MNSQFLPHSTEIMAIIEIFSSQDTTVIRMIMLEQIVKRYLKQKILDTDLFYDAKLILQNEAKH